MLKFIQNIRDSFYFLCNEHQEEFLKNIHQHLIPFWNIVIFMPKACEYGSINIFDHKYDISVYKRDLFMNLDSGMSIRVKNTENNYEFIEFEFHGDSTHIWYFLDSGPMVEEVRNRKGMKKYFRWSEDHLEEFYKKLKFLAIGWV